MKRTTTAVRILNSCYTLPLFVISILVCSCSEDSVSLPNVMVSEIWTSGFSLDWESKTGQLQVELALDEAFDQSVLDSVLSRLPVDIKDLSSGTTYYLRYRFISGGSKSKVSEVVAVQTLNLLQPQNVRYNNVTGDEIQLDWDEFRGATFDLQLALDNEFSSLISGFEQLSVQGNSILIEPLNPLTTYFIRIRSSNHGETSGWVELEGITTSDLLIFQLRSADFDRNGTIPSFFSCTGPPPELHWKNAPQGTVSFAITMEDLDFQNGFNHWIVFNIPASTTEIPQGSTGTNKPNGSIEGTNDLGATGYFGPCPPAGQTHRYYFTLHALDRDLTFNSTVRIDAFLAGIESSTLATTLLIGNYR